MKSLAGTDSAFTLIELLVTLAVIGILSAIAIPMFQEYRNSAWETHALNMTKSLQQADETYYADHEEYLDCNINSGVSNCPALPGLTNVDLTGVSAVLRPLTDGILIGSCNVKALHGYAFVSDPAHPFFTDSSFQKINLSGGVGSCSPGEFAGI